MDQSALARPAVLPDREHELERVRAALRAVADPYPSVITPVGSECGSRCLDPSARGATIPRPV
jgi:hypothetical protein